MLQRQGLFAASNFIPQILAEAVVDRLGIHAGDGSNAATINGQVAGRVIYSGSSGNDDVTIVFLPDVGHEILVTTPGYWDRLRDWLGERTAT